MKAGADMRITGKTVCVFVLLTVTKVTRTVGNNSVSATVGNSSVLVCSLKPNTTLVTWKISPKTGGFCTLGYRADQNKTDRTNCSDSVNWKFRPDQDPALEIQQVGIVHEGNYTCEVVATEGNFHRTYHLTVLVPPRLILHCDDHGNPVCEAEAGRPPAQISWDLESNSTPREEVHDDGTVTVVSMFTAHSTNVTNMICIVSHPAGNQSNSITCHPSKNSFNLHVTIILCVLTIITIMAVICYFKLHSDRLCHKPSPPETDLTHSPQAKISEVEEEEKEAGEPIPQLYPPNPETDDTMEVEPYTTYVQKENVIYNSVSDLTVGQSLPQGLSPST